MSRLGVGHHSAQGFSLEPVVSFLSLLRSLSKTLVTHYLRLCWGSGETTHCRETDAARSLVQMGEMYLTQLNIEKSQQCEKNWQLDDPT